MRLLRGVLGTLLALGWLGVASCSFPEYIVTPGHPELCDDFLLNGGETDTDCGGADCDACSQSRRCVADRDCTSRRCAFEVCQAPSCDDGVKNGTETGRDCGGNCAEQKCADGEGCVGGTDCESQVCTRGECQAPTCDDSTHNGGESDVDCGGGNCEPCSDGRRCDVNRDCVGRLCDRNTCVPVHCTDDLVNENETDVDCGGPCAPCDAGAACKLGTDCASKVCSKAICATPACDDEVENGEETDRDCGGADCAPCGDSLACLAGSDCENGVCQGGHCQAASCTDSVKNGEEADLDCGGECPSACRAGQGCRIHDDCVTGACVDGECVATLQIFYRNQTASQSTFVHPFLQLRNTGPTGVALSELELRYFYTNDGAPSEVVDCYFAQPGCDKLTLSIVALTPARPRADHYLSVKFDASAGNVPVNGSYGLELAVHEPSYVSYDQAGDYSYDPSKTSYAAHDKVCLYRKGILIWGIEPSP